MLLKLYIYGYLNRVQSSRRLLREQYADPEQGDHAVLDGIPDGRNHTCTNFVNSRAAQEMPVIEDLATTRTANSVSFADLTYTLYPVPHGNVMPKSINESSFDAD